MFVDISVIVPCYNEEENISIFYNEFSKFIVRIHNIKYEIIFVDDGSTDQTLNIIKKYAIKDGKIRFLSFSRNFGKEAAIFAGLEHAKGRFAVLMDADLQDPPSLLPKMYAYVKNGIFDSVATRRVSRKGEPKIRSFFAHQFYKLMNHVSKIDLVDGARDYRMMNRKFIDAILSLKEYNRFSKGLFGWVGFKTKWIEYENIERVAGETKWSFSSLFLYALDGIVAFSTFPLIISAILGIFISSVSFLSILFIIVRKLFWGDPVQGWASNITSTLFIGGILMLFIGIIGEYLAKIYLEIKKRPLYILKEWNFDSDQFHKKSSD